MTGLKALIKRNTKLFFKDKGLFFTSLITPLILLVLYVTFLDNVYRNTYSAFLDIPEKLLNGMVGGQLISALLAVCCVTVAFCSNMLMVQDKVNGTVKDLYMTPVKRSSMALGYYISTFISTFVICIIAAVAGLCYLKFTGWYLSAGDIVILFADIFLLVMFGTVISSIVNFFLSSQGQISAVGTIVSAGYGFICGAYMPISQFGEGVQRVISLLPGTYGTALLRNRFLKGVFAEMKAQGISEELITELKRDMDCTVSFFGSDVQTGAMYAVMAVSVTVLLGVYILLNVLSARKGNKK